MIDPFIASRKARWDRLSFLLGKVRRGKLRRLSAEEIEEFGLLYREAASDLALARREFPGSSTARYLNALLAQAHPYVYGGRAEQRGNVRRFFAAEFPRAFRRGWRLILLSFLVFFLPAIVSYVLVLSAPSAGDVLLPPGARERVEQVRESGSWADIPAEESSLAASTIMTNNIRVAILAFGGGVLLGLPTLLVLALNGLMLGAVAAAAQQGGAAVELWSFVSPHGWIELTVIFISGGAGLLMGKSILLPGLLTRRDALVAAAREAFVLLLGGAALLVLAGIIEGTVSPSPLSPAIKIAFGLASGAALHGYLLTAGRAPDEPDTTHTASPSNQAHRGVSLSGLVRGGRGS